jgi:UDP-N-acetylglucosamine--N-acetylmuramyl-(pentapeptide) pyrophosphoryl-undecaprenol N-acetylglucosamine transferase
MSRGVSRTALIMAAGTGGHVFPGLAIAEELAAQGWRIVWLGTPAGMEHTLVGRAGYPLEVVPMQGVRGKGLAAWLAMPVRLLRALAAARAIFTRVKPDVVISMGGYVAMPGGMMAALTGHPLVVHEPGAHAGLTNRVLALFARRVLVGFPKTFEQPPRNVLARLLPRPPRVEWLGTPVRSAITALDEPAVRFEGRDGPLRLLVVGGSLGAKTLNELVVAALAAMDVRSRPEVVHQAGVNNHAELLAAYQGANVAATVLPFIDDMAARLAWCDLMVCRSGAITVAELAAAGVASVLVPLPYFVAEEQDANARFLADAGAGILLKQLQTSPQELAALLGSFTRETLVRMAGIARGLGRPGAARACAAACAEMAA